MSRAVITKKPLQKQQTDHKQVTAGRGPAKHSGASATRPPKSDLTVACLLDFLRRDLMPLPDTLYHIGGQDNIHDHLHGMKA